jgi:enamine deaminase RidA (YjgF/YER057c/UK114 family)
MTRTMGSLRVALGLGMFGMAATALISAPAQAQNQHMEVIHHPNYDKTVFMPFVPAIKIKSGKVLWLAGTTALPVYHDHPHKRDQIQQYMVNDLEAQTRAAMDGIKQTLDASGASFKDVVHISFSGRGRGWATSARRAQSSILISRPSITSRHRPMSRYWNWENPSS